MISAVIGSVVGRVLRSSRFSTVQDAYGRTSPTPTRTPGGTHVAEPASCTIAGPSIVLPAQQSRAIVDGASTYGCAVEAHRARARRARRPAGRPCRPRVRPRARLLNVPDDRYAQRDDLGRLLRARCG